MISLSYNRLTIRRDKRPVVALGDKILATKAADAGADTSAEEREIDRLVYALYGLADEEVEAVEAR